jgi:hypothetical protein
MENITLMAVSQQIKDFLALPPGPLKNIKYNSLNNNKTWDASIVYKDGCMYYGCTSYSVAKSKYSYFLKATMKDGFTLDPKGKLQIWYGKSPKKIPRIDDVIKALGNDWYNSDYMYFLTKGILEKILTGKITNPLGFFEAWLKAQRIKASPRLLYKAIIATSCFSVYSRVLKYQSIFKHVDQFLLLMIDNSDDKSITSDFFDMCDQAVLLETMVDPSWSPTRVHIEHQRMTREIMELEIGELDNTPIAGLKKIKEFVDSYPDVILLDNRKAVFAEGKLMSHCIYTNYWDKIEKMSILCFHVDHKRQQGTLTIQLRKLPGTDIIEYVKYDFRDRFNREPGQDAKEYADIFIDRFNTWMTHNNVKLPNISDNYVIEPDERVLPF